MNRYKEEMEGWLQNFIERAQAENELLRRHSAHAQANARDQVILALIEAYETAMGLD